MGCHGDMVSSRRDELVGLVSCLVGDEAANGIFPYEALFKKLYVTCRKSGGRRVGWQSKYLYRKRKDFATIHGLNPSRTWHAFPSTKTQSL